MALLACAAMAMGGASAQDIGAGCSACEAKHSSPAQARVYLERASAHWPGHPKEAWMWSRIALSFDHGLLEAQALSREVADFCRAAPHVEGCDFVLRGAAKALVMPGREQAPE